MLAVVLVGWFGGLFFEKLNLRSILQSRAPWAQTAARSPRQGEVSGSRRAGGEPREQGRVGVPRGLQQHPAAKPLPTYRGRSSSSLQHPALPLPASKSFAIRCFGLSFLLRRGLNECEAILMSSGFSYCSINFSSLILTFQKGNLL